MTIDGTTKYLHWHLIADSDATKALLLASEAKTAVDGKSSTFLQKPASYSIGDLWIVGSDYIPQGYSIGEILTASVSSNAYEDSH